MAIEVGPALSGSANASIRGGSNPLGVSRAGGGERAGLGFSIQAQNFSTTRGENLRNFLNQSVKISRVDQIGFQSRTDSKPGFNSVKFLGDIPNNNPNKGNDSLNTAAKAPEVKSIHSISPKPQVIWFGPPIPVRIPEQASRDAQPEIAAKSLRFNLPKAESVPVKIASPGSEAKQINFDKAAVSQPEIVEPVKVGDILPRRQLSIVEQVNIAMMVKRARALTMRPKTQAIDMAGVESRLASEPEITSEKSPVPLKQENAQSMPLKTEVVRKTQQIKRRTKLVTQERQRVDPSRFRTRYVERDMKLNEQREKILIKGFDEAEKENLNGEVSGSVISKKTLIGVRRDIRSILLDQRGYIDREDGNQVRMDIFLGSLSLVKRNELRNIVKRFTAVKETYDPFEVASSDDVNNVVNTPKKIWESRFEPVEVVEIVNEGRVHRSEVVDSKKVELAPTAVIENKPAEAAVEEERNIQPVVVEMPLKPLGLVGHIGYDLQEILGLKRDLFPRRELVLN